MRAVHGGCDSTGMVRFLLDKGANIEAVDKVTDREKRRGWLPIPTEFNRYDDVDVIFFLFLH